MDRKTHMDQPTPPPSSTPAPSTATEEAVPASTPASSHDTATCTATLQENGSPGVGSDEGDDGKPGGSATDDVPLPAAMGSSRVGDDMLEMGGDAAAAAASPAAAAVASDGGQGKEQGKTYERKPRPPRVGSVRQGRKDKRKAEWKAKKARMKENKLYERRQREEAARKEGRELPSAGANYRDLPPEQWSVSQKINHAKRLEFEEKSTQGGYRVCIDMAFDDLMLEKAQASVGQQVMYAYSANRKAIQPCRITLSGLGEVMRAQVGKLTGFETWLGVATDSRCYTEIFDKEELVYLTADSPDTITQLEKSKVYILGGLVDRNAHKGLCFKKATDQGIATAKLPLKRGDLNGAHTKVLATNHVFDILVQAMGAGGNLDKIQEKTLPPRKRAGWTGGDDRGASSKPASKQAAGQEAPEGNLDPSTVDKSDHAAPTDDEGGTSAATSSREGHGPPGDSTPTDAEKTGQQLKHDSEALLTEPDDKSTDQSREAKGGSEGEVGVRIGGGEGVAQADGGVAVAGEASESEAVKRGVEGGEDLSSSPRVDGTCKRGRIETDAAGVA